MASTQYKKCNNCGTSKPISEFYKVRRGKYGVMGTCKKCISEKRKQRYHSDKELRHKRREKAREYYSNNKEKVKTYVKEWMKERPEYVNRYVKKWQQENREYYRKYIREYHRKYRNKKQE